MAWNEPGSNNDQDPWSGKRKPSSPPDLEQILRNWFKKLAGTTSTSGNGGSGFTFSGNNRSFVIVGLITVLVLVLWVLSGIFIVDPAERAVILRFGKYVETVGPGPHWIPRFIESAYIVNEQKIASYSYDAQMLTKDENIVSVAVSVQFRIDSARNFLFNVINPVESLQQATASALRQVIGRTTLDDVLTSGRELVRAQVQEQLAKTLGIYNAGLLVTDVAMQPAKAPDAVKEAFDDAIKAQEDEQRFVNQAQAYAMQVEPIAKGQAQRLLADAQAYKQQVVLHAQGDTSRFLALLPQYQKAPEVTRQRLYLDAIESVLTNSSKILVDTSSNNLMYLPLDKVMAAQQTKADADNNVAENKIAPVAPLATAPPAADPSGSMTNQQVDQTIYPLRGGY